MIANITSPLAIGQASDYYTLKEAEGFGSASVEVVKWDRPGFHGIKTPRAFWRERCYFDSTAWLWRFSDK